VGTARRARLCPPLYSRRKITHRAAPSLRRRSHAGSSPPIPQALAPRRCCVRRGTVRSWARPGSLRFQWCASNPMACKIDSGVAGVSRRQRKSPARGSAPSPRLPSGRLRPYATGYGEGRGEGAFPQAQTRGEAPSPGSRQTRDPTSPRKRGEVKKLMHRHRNAPIFCTHAPRHEGEYHCLAHVRREMVVLIDGTLTAAP
jgi:hypothetical protein